MATSLSTNNKLWKTFTLGCASAPPNRSACQKLKFGVPLSTAFKHDCIPVPLLNLLKYISQEGVTVPDIFRRPGNPNDQRKLIKRLSEGRSVDFSSYNFYTLASLIKKFLLSIPGGVFGEELENKLLAVLNIADELKQYDHINEVIRSLPRSTQHFLSLLFGVWFRIVNHIEFHSMSAEAMAKSVTGSIFLNSTIDPTLVNNAAKVMEIMIENFAITSIFGSDNLQYFADMTCSGIVVTERFTYHYKYPTSRDDMYRNSSLRSFAQHLRQECSSRGLLVDDEEEEKSRRSCTSTSQSPLLPSQARGGMVGCMSVPDVNTHNKFKSHLSLHPNYLDRNVSSSLSKFDTVKMKQMARLRKRSEWFLNTKQSPNITSRLTSRESEVSDTPADDIKSEVESVFDDRRSVDTTLMEKPLHEQRLETCDETACLDQCMHSPSSNDGTEIVTKHFVKQTTIVPRTNSTVIPC